MKLSVLLMMAVGLGWVPLSARTVEEITDVALKVDEQPVPIRTSAPEYPQALKANNTAGLVSLVIVIDETGNVLATHVSKSSHEGFNDAATHAVAKWKFTPAKLAGKAVKVKVSIPVRFSVSET